MTPALSRAFSRAAMRSRGAPVPDEPALLPSRPQVPDSEREIGLQTRSTEIGGGDGPTPVRGHCHGTHCVLMTAESTLLLTGLQIPDFEGAVV